jgi:hypothetical protein
LAFHDASFKRQGMMRSTRLRVVNRQRFDLFRARGTKFRPAQTGFTKSSRTGIVFVQRDGKRVRLFTRNGSD